MAPYTNPVQISSDRIHWQGYYYEQAALGNMFSYGGVSTTLVAANATATSLTATAQPIIGIYNPVNSGKNLVLVETLVLITNVAASAVSPMAFVYVSASGTAAAGISSGSTSIIQRQLGNPTPSVAKGFAFSTALTGLTGNLTNTNLPFNSTQIVQPEPSTATAQMGGQSAEDNQGSWILTPGSFLGVMGTSATTTVSVASRMIWIEIPVASNA